MPPPADDSQPDEPTAAMPPGTVTLIGRARAGDASACDELFRRFLPRVRGLVSMRAGHSLRGVLEDDDIVQQAMTDALTGLERLDVPSEAAFVCLLGRFVDARITDVWRKHNAAKRGGGNVRLLSEIGSTTRERNAPHAPGPSASEAFARAEELDRVEQAMLQLGDRSRLAVYLRIVLGMSFAEVAHEMELANAETARSLFNKAAARLEEILSRGQHDGPVSG
ncbi:MAG: sigma-70 family RNA polymerase sigma factor [Planctomycetes bacterium]|nr:sigma-70 family RNA polymerase sigma factor [Planctomycetota bacterium]